MEVECRTPDRQCSRMSGAARLSLFRKIGRGRSSCNWFSLFCLEGRENLDHVIQAGRSQFGLRAPKGKVPRARLSGLAAVWPTAPPLVSAPRSSARAVSDIFAMQLLDRQPRCHFARSIRLITSLLKMAHPQLESRACHVLARKLLVMPRAAAFGRKSLGVRWNALLKRRSK